MHKLSKQNGDIAQGSISIDVPGISRAFHSITIRPKSKKRLAIPIYKSAFGKKPSSFKDAFVVKSKNGSLFLARKSRGKLIRLFSLVLEAY